MRSRYIWAEVEVDPFHEGIVSMAGVHMGPQARPRWLRVGFAWRATAVQKKCGGGDLVSGVFAGFGCGVGARWSGCSGHWGEAAPV